MAKIIGQFTKTATETGTITGPTWNLRGFDSLHPPSDQIGGKLYAFMTVTAIAGAAPSVVGKFQYSYDDSNWTDVTSGAFSAATTTGVKELNAIAWMGAAPYLHYVSTFGGTTTSI